jgi:undecaprenyl-diphosphatase
MLVMKQNSEVGHYINMLKTPSVQVLLLGTCFVLVMLFVHLGVAQPMDEALFQALKLDGSTPKWISDALRDVTALGSNIVLLFVAITVTVGLAMHNQRNKAYTFVLAVALGLFVAFALKAGIARPRPPVSQHDVDVYTHSFPSAHATLSTLVYFYLAYLVCHFSGQRAVSTWIYSTAALLVFCIGLSRVMLGVHWPSDVIGGWFAGGSVVALCLYTIKWKQKLHIHNSEPQQSKRQ